MKNKFVTIREFINFLLKRKLWFLIPIVIVLFTLGLIVILLGSSPLAPIVYPLF